MRVQGVGPVPCQLMLVGEGPGWHESLSGVPFVETAPAGGELTRYCNGTILPWREEIYITNLVKEWADGKPTKEGKITQADVERDEWELKVERGCVQPRLTISLGSWSTRWHLGQEVDMEAVHGLLFKLPDGSYLLPCYHPAAGLHRPEMAARTAYDLARASEILKLPVDQWDSRAWWPRPLGHYFKPLAVGGFITAGEVGADSEGTLEKPVSYQIAPAVGTGLVIQGEHDLLWVRHLAKVGKTFVFHNAMWELQMADVLKIPVGDDQFHDTQVMAYLLGVEPQGLKALALRHLGMQLKDYQDVVGKWVQEYTKTGKPKKKLTWVLGTLDDVPVDEFVQYAGADPDATLQVKGVLWNKIVDQGLEQVYEIDRRCLPIYARMETVGMPINMDHFTEFGKWLADELAVKTMLLQCEYPDLNPASADQVAAIMFGHLKLPGAKKTPSGERYSTNDKILQSLKGHPFVAAIIEWRELQKLKTTFVDSLPSYCRWHHHPVNAYGSGPAGGYRLHYRLLPTRVVSGRLAAKDPNVLALPKHSELGKRFRAGVQASPGCVLGSWDLDQIELRVLALDSGSPALVEIFQQGVDLHSNTGHKIFGVEPDKQDDSLHRLPSKTTNFSIIMGTTGIGLAEQQRKNGYPFPELQGHFFATEKARHMAQADVCQQWVNRIILEWGIEGYIAGKHAEARRYGYVVDLWGRRRYLPSVLSPNKQIREEALRQAQSFGPQAGARGFYKQIIVRVWREVIKPLQAEGWYIEPIIDLHDDFLYEVQEEIAEMAHRLIGEIFCGSFSGLAVPITAKGDLKKRWSELKGRKL